MTSKSKKRIRRSLMTVAIVATAAAGAWFGWAALDAGAAAEPPATYDVRRGGLLEVASASGTIEPHVQVELKSRISGEVVEVLVEEGQDVSAGDVLVRLDPIDATRAVAESAIALRRIQSDLTQSYASLEIVEAQVRQAEANVGTARRGVEMGLVSAEQLRDAEVALETAAANVRLRTAQIAGTRGQREAATLAVEEARLRQTETEIRAPIDGTVLSVDVERGSIVSSGMTSANGGTVLMTIADLGDLRVIGAIDEAQVGRVEAGQRVVARVDAYPDRTFAGTVERVARLGRNESSVVTFDVEITIEDEHGHLLRSGMSADVDIVIAEHADALLIPLTAVRTVGGRQTVTKPDGTTVAIRTGATEGGRIEVLRGLEAGDVILASGVMAAASTGEATAPEARDGDSVRRMMRRSGMGGGGGGRGGGMR
jgi:HlyD family secretion protein